jgi:transposase
MSILPVFVGLDYHQNSIQICVLNETGKVLVNRSISNSASLVAKISCQHGVPRRIAIEACCGAADLAEELVTDWQLPVQMAHPGYVNRIKQSPDKTDFGDARMLADLARVNYIPKVWLAPRETRELRRVVRHRSQLVERRKNTKLRIRGLLRENRLKCETAQAWTVAWLTWLGDEAELRESDRWVLADHLAELASLKGRIANVETKIKRKIKDDPMVARLMALPGVGLITAVTFRAEVGRVDRFHNAKQLARFCGVTPRNASSGDRQADAGLIKAGNPELRKVLIELAQRLLWSPNRWSDLGAKLLRRGKRKTVVVAAIANRWVRWLYHELQRPVGVAIESDSAAARQKELNQSMTI